MNNTIIVNEWLDETMTIGSFQVGKEYLNNFLANNTQRESIKSVTIFYNLKHRYDDTNFCFLYKMAKDNFVGNRVMMEYTLEQYKLFKMLNWKEKIRKIRDFGITIEKLPYKKYKLYFNNQMIIDRMINNENKELKEFLKNGVTKEEILNSVYCDEYKNTNFDDDKKITCFLKFAIVNNSELIYNNSTNFYTLYK